MMISFSQMSLKGAKKLAKAVLTEHLLQSRREQASNQRTFFSLSIHLLIAMVDDPVRSLRAEIASLINAMVVMVFR